MKYRESKQVREVIKMIIESRIGDSNEGWVSEGHRRFNMGYRHGIASTLRRLVELESKIEDPEELDELCADLIDNVLENMS